MSVPTPQRGPQPFESAPGGPTSRRTSIELAQIYVSASAFAAAIDVLDRLPANDWDEEARLLRAEALMGLGRVPEAEQLLGPPILPTGAGAQSAASGGSTDGVRDARPRAGASEDGPAPGPRPLLPRVPARGQRRRVLGRRERHSLWRFLLQLKVLHRTGRYREVLQLGRVFFGSQKLQPNVFIARIATVMAQSTYALRRPGDARELYEEVLELYKQLRSREGVADTVLGIANTQLQDCRWDEADALYQEARFRYEEMGQSDKALACLINLGVLRAKRGDLSGGAMLLNQALTRSGQMGDAKRSTTVLLALGWISVRTGDLKSARSQLLRAIRQGKKMHAPRVHALALEYLGELYLLQGRVRRARTLLSGGLGLARQISPTGDLVFEIRRRQAEVALLERSYDEARALAMESLQGAREFGDLYEAATTERVLALCDEAAGNLARAGERVRQAIEALDRLGETFERTRLELLRIRLDRGMALIGAGEVEAKVAHALRPFASYPDAPLFREARMLLGARGHTRRTPKSVMARQMSPSQSLTTEDLQQAERFGLVGQDPEYLNALMLARAAATLPAPVLLLGEQGTGKSTFARLIHLWSKREGNFITFHCADLNDMVIGTELFGDAPGTGLLAAARGGTLFFDEIAELPPGVQRRLLAWLDDHTSEVRVIGASRYPSGDRCAAVGMHSTMSNVPAVAGSTRVDEARRRIGRVMITLPSLHARRNDLPLLMEYFATQTRQRFGLPKRPLPESMVSFFLEHPWAGNLRELRQAVERFVLAESTVSMDGESTPWSTRAEVGESSRARR